MHPALIISAIMVALDFPLLFPPSCTRAVCLQAREFEIARKKRDQELKVRRQRETAPYLFQTGRNGIASSSGTINIGDLSENNGISADRAQITAGFHDEQSSSVMSVSVCLLSDCRQVVEVWAVDGHEQ